MDLVCQQPISVGAEGWLLIPASIPSWIVSDTPP